MNKTLASCSVCGDDFYKAGPRSLKCERCKQKKCLNCKEVLLPSRTGVTCSSLCAAALRSKKLKEKLCAFDGCGKIFTPSNPMSKWCAEEHELHCNSCGDHFRVKSNAPKEFCSSCRKEAGNRKRRESQKKTFQEKYGMDSPFHSKEIQEKVVATNLQRYGVRNQGEREEVKSAIKLTNLEKFGVEHSFQAQEVKEKIRATLQERYGATAPMQSEELKEKQQATLLENYGVTNPSQSALINQRKKSTYLKNYGVDHPMKNAAFKEEFFSNFKKKNGLANPLLLPNAVPGRISKPNRQWHKLLEEATGLSWALEKNIKGAFNVDLYCEHAGVKLAVEINPTATHNSYKHLIACNRRGCEEFPCTAHAKNKKYHYGRVRKLQESGIQLVSVFDWHNEERIIQFIKAKLRLAFHKVGARKCQLRKISQKEANSFLREFHLMGASRKQTHCYGLFFEELLVQVQTFTPLGDNRWEAKRLATRDDWAIAGGVSKGTKAFITEVKPDEIIAFSDLNLSMAGFDSLFNGFEPKEIQAPSKCWSKDNRMVLAKSAAFQSADRLLGIAPNSQESKYPPEWSNEQVFLAEGWLPVWDCGKLKEVLNLQ